MFNFVVLLASLVPFGLEIQFSSPIPPHFPATLAPLYGTSSTSLALDLASKISVLTFVRSDPCGHSSSNEYLVKFHEYSLSKSTWETFLNVTNSLEIFSTFYECRDGVLTSI